MVSEQGTSTNMSLIVGVNYVLYLFHPKADQGQLEGRAGEGTCCCRSLMTSGPTTVPAQRKGRSNS